MPMSHMLPSVADITVHKSSQMQRFSGGHGAFGKAWRMGAMTLVLVAGLGECYALWRARLRLGLSGDRH